MKNIQTLLFGILFIFSVNTVKSQCTDDNAWSGDPTVVTGCPGTASATLDAGEYIIIDIVQGNIYTFSTCDLAGNNCDSYLTLIDGAGTAVAFNDDGGSGTPSGCSEFSWSATGTGTIGLYLDRYQNAGQPCQDDGCTDITINISCSAPPANTEPCGAVSLVVDGGCQTFDNTNAGNSTTPLPTCGNYVGNDMWFTFTVGATGGANIDLGALGMTDSEMAIYTSGTNDCNNLLQVGCDDDGGAGLMSNLDANFPPGTQIWVRVWGFNDEQGTFQVCVTETVPAVTASDCSAAINVCTNAGFTINPNGVGSVNDVPAPGSTGNPSCATCSPMSNNEGCLRAGETNSTWMVITIEQTGNLEFTFGAGGAQAGYYDWIVWPYNDNCGTISGGTVAPVTCNWNSNNSGGTGAVSTVPAGGFAGNYEPPLPVVCGEQYLVCFSNYSGSQSNVPIAFAGTASVSCQGGIAVGSTDILICEGTSGDLTAVGADTYEWNPALGLSSTTGGTVTANPTVTTSYTVTGTTGCLTDDTTITVTVEPAPNVVPSYIHPVTGATVNDTFLTTCENSVITLNATGSVNGYVWSPSTGLSCTNCDSPDVTLGTTDITYTVTGYSANNCPFTSEFNFIIADPEVTFTVIDETCDGTNDGSATVNVSGGTPTFSYSWDTSPIQTTQIINNLADGNYQVTVTDANGCTAIGDTTILPGIIVNAGITPMINQCLSGNSFDFTNTGSNGGGETYAWNFGDAGPGTSSDENPTYSYPDAGTFTVEQIVNSGICADTANTIITVNLMPTATLITDSVDCFSTATGEASISLPVPNGQSPLTFDWNPLGETSNTATGLLQGDYTVIVTDANLCPDTIDFTIYEPAILAPTASKTDPTCNGFTDGTATATGIGGTASYSYSWDTNPVQTTATATGLGAGTYTCTVTDFHNCSEDISVTLIDPPGMTLTPSMNPANCGLPDGDATVNVAGGIGGFSFDWNDGSNQTTQTATGLAASTYTVIVTDLGTATGCTADTTITITTTAGITANATLIRDALCTDSLDGMAYATPVGGAPTYTYSWDDGFGEISTNDTLTAGAGTYTVMITDGSGCTGDTTITIGEPTQVIATITDFNNPNCFGARNGDATALGSGGTVAGSYTYLWNTSPAQDTSTATGLGSGTYIVTVMDDNLCADTASITLIDGPQLTSTIIADSINCFGGNDGSINYTVNSGTNPTFSWTPSGSNLEDPQDLSAGMYYVTVNTDEGCILNDSIEVFEPAELITVLDSTFNASCFSFSDGAVYTSTTGGTGTYIYSWNSTPAQNTNNASFLSFGVYNLTVTDNNNCQTTTIANIDQPAPLDAVFGSFDAYCSLDQGTAWISPTNGTAPYIYAWDSAGTAIGATDTITGLYPGNYNVQIDDSNGCKFNTIVTVDPAQGGTATISASTDVSCFAGDNGSATVSTSNAFPGFTYLWDDAAAQTTNPATGLTQGNYNVTVTDTFGCVMTTNVTIAEPTALNLTLLPNPQTCPDSCNAVIATTLNGGTSPYTYIWNDPAISITPSVGGLCGGTYSVTATDSLGCTITDSAAVTVPPVMTLGNVVTPANCNQADGEATASVASNGVAPFTFVWEDNTNTVVGNSATLSGVEAGTYYATATDSLGCSVTDTVNIPNLNGPSIALDSIYNVQCFAGNDGYAEVQITGGTTPYTYVWNDPANQTTPSASNLTAGSYIVNATDSNGCLVSLGIDITEPTDITLTSGGTDPSCFGYTDGSVWVNANGGNTNGGEYSYLWNDPAATANDTVYNLGAGLYAVTVADSNNCFKFIDVTLNNPLLLTVSATGNNVTCAEACNGEATATVTNGVGVISYLWDDPSAQTTPNASGLCDTTATVLVTDAMGCTATDAITITQPDSLLVSEASHANVSCFNGNDGFSSLNVTGGTGNITYSWNLTGSGVVNTNQAANNLIAGSYLVTISDANGCSTSININITQPNPLTADVSPSDADCAGANTGSANTNVIGGTSPYSYQWNDVELQQTALADSLLAGTYQVVVSDSLGCSFTVNNIVIDEPAPITLSATTTPSTCGNPNGTAAVAFGGGTGTPNFVWNTTPVQNTATAIGLDADNYTVFVTDQNGCTDSTTASVTDLGGPTASIPAFTNASCAGINDGTAQSSVSGGAYPYTFLWSGGATPNDSLATGLAGTVGGQDYDLTITDNNGCIATASVTISENPNVVAVINDSNDVSCFGLADGNATVVANGGTGAGTYSYAWSPLGGNAPQATNLIAGNYTVTITDGNNCTTTDQVTITQPELLTIDNFNIDSVSCSGNNDGLININVVGGTSGYNYAWTPASSGAGPTASGLFEGAYGVVVTDQHGCTTSGNYDIYTPDPLAIGTIIVQSTCGNTNGSAEVTLVTGGTTPYSYSWNTPGAPTLTALADNISAGTYVVSVTDANGCFTNEVAVVTDKPLPVLDSIVTTNVTCNGLSNGSAIAFGSGTAPITYSWNGNPFQNNGNYNGLTASLPLYTVTVKDSNNCTVSGVTQITQPAPLSANINAPNSACFGEVIQLFANGNGGTTFDAPNDLYNITWTTMGNAVGQGPMTDSLITNVVIHKIEVVDANGCIAEQTHTIVVSPQLTINPTTQPICEGEIATLNAASSGGNPNNTITYSWDIIDSTSLATTPQGIGNPFNVNPVTTTDYIVTADDGCSLPVVGGVKLIVNPIADVQLYSDTFVGCPDLIVDLKAIPISGGTGTSFQWDFNGDGIFDLASVNDSINYTYSTSGVFDVSVITTTAAGCLDTITSFGHVTVYQTPDANFTTDPSPAIVSLLNPTIEFTDLSDANDVLALRNWNFGDGDFGTETNPIHNYQDTGFYDVMLTIVNLEGCRDSISKTIQVKPEFLFIIPNTITPDGDGLNDVFMPGTIIGADEEDYSFYIFDRWGELLYEGHNLSSGWDGFYKGKLVKTGVYVWRVEIKDFEGVIHKYTGHVNVLK